MFPFHEQHEMLKVNDLNEKQQGNVMYVEAMLLENAHAYITPQIFRTHQRVQSWPGNNINRDTIEYLGHCCANNINLRGV